MLFNPPTAHQCGRFILKIVGILSLAISFHALVKDAGMEKYLLPVYHLQNTLGSIRGRI